MNRKNWRTKEDELRHRRSQARNYYMLFFYSYASLLCGAESSRLLFSTMVAAGTKVRGKTTQVKLNSRALLTVSTFALKWMHLSPSTLTHTNSSELCKQEKCKENIPTVVSLCRCDRLRKLIKKCHTANLPRKNDSFISTFEALSHSFWREFLSWLRKYFLDGSTRIRIVKWWDYTCTEDLQPSRASWAARRLENAKNGK